MAIGAVLTWLRANRTLALVACALLTLAGYRGWLYLRDHKNIAAGVAKCEHVEDTKTIRDLEERLAAKDQKIARYDDEISLLKSLRDAAPPLVVRLCPSTPALAGGSRAAGAGAGAQVSQSSIDYGPALFDLADQYDALVARVRLRCPNAP